MSTTRWLLMGMIVVAVAAGIAGWGHVARAYAAPAAAGVEIMPGGGPIAPQDTNPIVSVVAGTTETEYEQDPFDQTRVRRATNRVRSLVYVHADGTIETKQVP